VIFPRHRSVDDEASDPGRPSLVEVALSGEPPIRGSSIDRVHHAGRFCQSEEGLPVTTLDCRRRPPFPEESEIFGSFRVTSRCRTARVEALRPVAKFERPAVERATSLHLQAFVAVRTMSGGGLHEHRPRRRTICASRVEWGRMLLPRTVAKRGIKLPETRSRFSSRRRALGDHIGSESLSLADLGAPRKSSRPVRAMRMNTFGMKGPNLLNVGFAISAAASGAYSGR